MSKKDKLMGKGVGDRWGSVMAPEELRYWNLDYPWKKDCFSKFNLIISFITIRAETSVGKTQYERFSHKNKLLLNCGVEVTDGTFSKRAGSEYARVKLVVDSIKEFNFAMTEMVELRGTRQWEIRRFAFYNPKFGGAKVTFAMLNPDSQGPQLYFEKIEDGNGERQYDIVPGFEQAEYCNHFQDRYAACELRYVKTPIVDCVMKTFDDLKKNKK